MNVTFMNPVAEKMSGWQQDSAIGIPLLTVLHITFGENGPLMENIYSADMSRTAIEQEVVLHCRNGNSYDIQYSITPSAPLTAAALVRCWLFRTSQSHGRCSASLATVPHMMT
jgi:PAS domain-containing protein